MHWIRRQGPPREDHQNFSRLSQNFRHDQSKEKYVIRGAICQVNFLVRNFHTTFQKESWTEIKVQTEDYSGCWGFDN